MEKGLPEMMASVLRGILQEVEDMDFAHPHAWEAADIRLQDAQRICSGMIAEQVRDRFGSHLKVMDQAILKINGSKHG